MQFVHEVADFLPHGEMIKSFEVFWDIHFRPLALGAQSSEIAVAVAYGNVIQGEFQGKPSSSRPRHDPIGHVQPNQMVTAAAASSARPLLDRTAEFL